MNAIENGRAESHDGRVHVAGHWLPVWAVAVAVGGMVLMLLPLWYGVTLLTQGTVGDPSTSADAFATALGQVALVVAAAVLAAFGWFLLRGNWIAFTLGATLTAIGIMYVGADWVL